MSSRGAGPAQLGIGITLHSVTPARVAERARLIDKLGFDSVWVPGQEVGEFDVGVLLAAVAGVTHRVALCTGVLPIYPRHPVDLAQMAATLDELSGGRLRLALGVGHQLTTEWVLGVPMGHPRQAMREYLTIVASLVRGGAVNFAGERFSARATYSRPPRPDMPIMMAALSPRMLRLAAQLADGVVLWLCSARYLRDRVMPLLREAREECGRSMDDFAVVCYLPVCMSSRPAEERDRYRGVIARYWRLPYYRRVLQAGGFASQLDRGVVDDDMLDQLTGIGSADAVDSLISTYRDAGCTLAVAVPVLTAHLDDQAFAEHVEALAHG
jgi:F420-dependent oxidoreductase-like protein